MLALLDMTDFRSKVTQVTSGGGAGKIPQCTYRGICSTSYLLYVYDECSEAEGAQLGEDAVRPQLTTG
jgi:hypothetical protein